MAENAASAHRPARPAKPSALGPRILSALVLAPAALAAVWWGVPATAAFVALAAGLMAWEWGTLVGRLRTGVDAGLFIGTAAAAVLAAGFVSVGIGALVAAAGIAALVMLGVHAQPRWTALGMAWVILPSIGFVWLRSDPIFGLRTVLWMLALVWAVDIAAYAVGRSIGGPKLVWWISPNKTWAGLAGGVAAALLVGLTVGALNDPATAWRITLASGGLAVVEQIGDIAESYAKRRFGAKDAGTLIPGHGGVLDRLDGMLAVISAVVLLSVAGGNEVIWR